MQKVIDPQRVAEEHEVEEDKCAVFNWISSLQWWLVRKHFKTANYYSIFITVVKAQEVLSWSVAAELVIVAL